MFMSFLLGVAAGLFVAVPVGPICVLCVQRSLAYGRTIGIISGMGSVLPLCLYGTLSAYGVTATKNLPFAIQLTGLLVGALILSWMGFGLLRATIHTDQPASDGVLSPARAFVSIFLLEMVNPSVPVLFLGLFIALGNSPSSSPLTLSAIAAGIFVASAVWWIVLCVTVSLTRGFFTQRRMTWLNRVSGVVIIGLGVQPLVSLLVTRYLSS